MNPLETNQTNTSIFLLPPLQINIDYSIFWNAYLSDDHHVIAEEDDQHLLYCLFKPDGDGKFEKLIVELENKDIIVEDYDYDNGFCVLVLKFPKQYNADFNLILEGKYSQTSKFFKSLFPMYIEEVGEDGKIIKIPTIYNGVFNKGKELRKEIEEYFGIDMEDCAEYWPHFYNKPASLNIERIYNSLKSTQ